MTAAVYEPQTPAASAAVELLLRFARAGHDAGYPTAELEERVLTLAHAFGVGDAQVAATPTLVDVSLGALPAQRTFTLRVRPKPVDLDAIARLDDLVRRVVDRKLESQAALRELEAVEASPLDRPWPVLLAAYALAAVALATVLGGGWREVAAAALVGLLVGAVAIPASRAVRTEPVVAPVAAIVASFSAAALARAGLEISPDVVTLAALVTLLPGIALTIGVRELATDHLQSGVANTARALVQLLGLVFGVGVGVSVAKNWFGAAPNVEVDTGFAWAHVAAAVVAGLAFTVTLRAQRRDALVMCAATVLALGATEIGTALLGEEAAVFAAALAVGVVGGLLGARADRSPLVFIVPGVLMLVPGSTAFESALHLLANQTVSGMTTAFDTFVTAMSIAYGLMVSVLIVPLAASWGRPTA